MKSTIQNDLAKCFISTDILPGEKINITEALNLVAGALIALGNNGAATGMGGLEAHGKALLDSAQIISNGLSDVAESIRDLAEAIKESGK